MLNIPITPGPTTVGDPVVIGPPTTTTPGEPAGGPADPTPTITTDPVLGSPNVTTTLGQPSPALVSGIPSSLPITVTNIGDGPTTGPTTVTLPIPTDVTVPGPFTAPGGWTCTATATTVTCTNPTVIPAGGSLPVLNIPITPGPTTVGDPVVIGPPTTTTPGEPAGGPADPTPTITTDPVLGSPNVTTTLGQPSPTLHVGIPSSLPITVTNIGDGPTTGPTTVTLPIPTDVTVPGPFTAPGGWTCTATATTVTCTNPTVIPAGGSLPVLNIPITPGPTTVGDPVVIGPPTTTTPGEPAGGPADPTPTITTDPVLGSPNVTTTLGQPSPALVSGIPSSLPITVTNIGDGPTTGPTTVTLPIPTDVTAPGPFTAPGGWTCTATATTVTCTNPTVIPAGGSLPVLNIPITPGPTTVGDPVVIGPPTTTTPGEPAGGPADPTPTITTDPVVEATSILPIKVILGGGYLQATGLITDGMRVMGVIPLTEPYTGMPIAFTHVNGGGGESVNASVFSATGPNAIVDWVFIELRSAASNTTVVATRAGLVQRDGDVVGVDGLSALVLPGSFTNQIYYIAVRHRNHLGVMTASPVLLTSSTALIDFTAAATSVYGTHAQRILTNGVHVLWAGNANNGAGGGLANPPKNLTVVANGANTDRAAVLSAVLGNIENELQNKNYVIVAYRTTDVNLDGLTKAAGGGDDTALILTTIFKHPLNLVNLNANAVIAQQLP